MKISVKFVSALAAGAMLAGGIAMADNHVQDIKKRQEAMKQVGGGMKVIVETVKGKRAFDGAAIKAAATTIKTNLGMAAKLFPEGSGEEAGVKTRAKPEIWLDQEGFVAALKKAIAAADNATGVTEQAALMPALQQLGGACKGCHEKFRLPKK